MGSEEKEWYENAVENDCQWKRRHSLDDDNVASLQWFPYRIKRIQQTRRGKKEEMKHDRKRNDTTLRSLSLSCHSVNWKWQEKKWSVRCQDKKKKENKLYKTATKLVSLQRKVILVGIFCRSCNCFIFRSSSSTIRYYKTNESSFRRKKRSLQTGYSMTAVMIV